jgi:hypothetical protein
MANPIPSFRRDRRLLSKPVSLVRHGYFEGERVLQRTDAAALYFHSLFRITQQFQSIDPEGVENPPPAISIEMGCG